MNVEIENPGPSLDASSIVAFESEIGRLLPEQYRGFLEQYNGGQPWPDCIDVESFPESPTDIQVFFGLGRGIESSDLRWIIKTYSDLVREDILPIACDSGGNLFCIKLHGKEDGIIIYCDRSHVETPPYYVADSFSQLLKLIREL